MARAAISLFFSLGLVSGQWREAKPDEIPATFKSTVSLVRVDVEVADRGRSITGLKKEDFVVRDNGAPVALDGIGREEVPLDLILMFDVSGSMRPVVEAVASVAWEALRELREGDRVAVMDFSTRTRTVLPFTTNLRAVERSIREDVLSEPFSGSTPMLRAADNAALKLLEEKRGDRRRAVLFITDNEGQRTMSEGTVVDHLWEADAVVCGLIVSGYSKAARVVGGILNPTGIVLDQAMRVGLGGLADKTGGDLVKASSVERDFPAMMQRLRLRYTLFYPMPKGKAGEHRKVLVELAPPAKQSHPEARVYARKGYILPEPDPAP